MVSALWSKKCTKIKDVGNRNLYLKLILQHLMPLKSADGGKQFQNKKASLQASCRVFVQLALESQESIT